jgi:hemolysin activation/secretion protein
LNKISILMLAATVGGPAYAQSTTAGGQFQQIPPAPITPRTEPEVRIVPRAVAPAPSAAGTAIAVRSLHVTGQTLFPEATLIAASGFVPGAMLDLAGMRALAARISAYYNERGYFLAQAYLPAQDIQNGDVTIAVVEGRYGKIDVRNRTNLIPAVPRKTLRGLAPGGIITSAPLERRLLLLSDMPGVAVTSTLAPGSAIGTSDLLVDLAPTPRITGSVEADNAGNRYTGAYRFGGTINVNNPAGIGDLLSGRVLASTSGLAYGRVAYQAPIGNLTVGAAYAHIRYDLGREFKSLDADGTADVASLYASYPLIRTRDANLYAVGGIDAKRFRDRVNLFSTDFRKRSYVGSVGLNGDWRDGFGGGGASTASIGWTHGDLDIRSPLQRAIDADSARSNGGFDKLNLAAARIQTISGPLSLYLAARGQVALDNLDSSEKMELGGAYGVRAYPEGEAYGDEGYIATAELRLRLDQWTRGLPGRFQLIGFVDSGEVDYAHNPWFSGPNHARRSGYGAGLSWAGPERILISATYARKLGNADVTSGPDRSGRAWFQIVKLF